MSGISEALVIATVAHMEQKDEKGLPYIYHPIFVMNSMELDDEDGRVVGVLHDTVEDTHVTEDYLRINEFSEENIKSLMAITKRYGEAYDAYLARVKEDWTATRVKIQDARHNLKRNMNELVEATAINDLKWMAKSDRRVKKYARAITFLEGI